jgi:hypothetical protein
MSQSDYLKHKKIATRLKIDNDTVKQPPVFDSKSYIQFKQFEVANSVENTKLNYNNITPDGVQSVFGVDRVVTDCTNFPLCMDTHLRTNRIPMLDIYSACRPIPLTVTQRNAAANLKNSCNCGASAQNGGDPCKCSLGRFGIVR